METLKDGSRSLFVGVDEEGYSLDDGLERIVISVRDFTHARQEVHVFDLA